MSMQTLSRETIGEGIGFSSLKDSKFRHNGITINLITPLKDETVKDESVLINDQSSDSDDSDDETVMWPWVMAGGLAVVAFTLAR